MAPKQGESWRNSKKPVLVGIAGHKSKRICCENRYANPGGYLHSLKSR